MVPSRRSYVRGGYRDDIVIHTGGVDFVRDKLAEEFHCWWTGNGIPEAVWRELDMGVQRRMVAAGHWAEDPS